MTVQYRPQALEDLAAIAARAGNQAAEQVFDWVDHYPALFPEIGRQLPVPYADLYQAVIHRRWRLLWKVQWGAEGRPEGVVVWRVVPATTTDLAQ